MAQSEREKKEAAALSYTLLSWITLLVVLLLAFVGTVAYGRLDRQSWAIYRRSQAALDSLTQQTGGLDAKLASVLQELETLEQEQALLRSRIEALEAERAQIEALQSEVALLNRQLDGLSEALEDLAREREAAQKPEGAEAIPTPPREEGAPESALLGVPLHRQSYPLSCEAAAASMVAAFFGVPLSEEEVIAALPRHENPNRGFRGDIDGLPGGIEDYGVHAGPIQELLTARGLKAEPVEGGLEGIRRALQAGHPVIAWVTYRLWEQKPMEIELTDGTRVKVVPYEHTVVVAGYNADGLWALDPYDGERQLLPWAEFERSWQYLDQMALEVAVP